MLSSRQVLSSRGNSVFASLFGGVWLLLGSGGCGVGLEGLFHGGDGGVESSTGEAAPQPELSISANPDAADGSLLPDTASESAITGGGDGGVTCPGAAPSPCVNPASGSNDFCSNGSGCAPCVDVADDVSCTTVYRRKADLVDPGRGAPTGYLCLGGACVPGECRANSDCTTSPHGTICGATVPSVCGKCSTDAQCASTGPTSSVCDTGTGQCAAGACTPNAANRPAACPVSQSDICCASACQASGAANSCCPGPGANAYCALLLGNNAAACIGTVCTACPPVTGTTFAVDPLQGSDQAGTGNPSVAGCAYRTITRALQVVGTSLSLATTIAILGPSTVDAGETFPVRVPANVSITTSGGPVVIHVSPMQAGFLLTAPNSGVGGSPGAPLTLSGQSATATNGIVASSGSQTTTRISNVTVTGFLNAGIVVDTTGTLVIGPGVNVTANGTGALRRNGMHVTGGGHAIIDVPFGAAPTHFDANTDHGILVDGGGYITLTGVVSDAAAGVGTVTANANFNAGLGVRQTPGTPPQNVITGLVTFGSMSANGMLFVAGSNVKVRNSASLNNHVAGVFVSGVSGNTDISKIDLGNPTSNDYGNNTLQSAVGMANNGVAGICLEAPSGSGTLLAVGNAFGGANCAAATGRLTTNHGAGAKATCMGHACDLSIVGSGNDIDVAMCTHL